MKAGCLGRIVVISKRFDIRWFNPFSDILIQRWTTCLLLFKVIYQSENKLTYSNAFDMRMENYWRLTAYAQSGSNGNIFRITFPFISIHQLRYRVDGDGTLELWWVIVFLVENRWYHLNYNKVWKRWGGGACCAIHSFTHNS